MEFIKIKRHTIKPPVVKDSYNRRAVQFQNNIIKALKKTGVSEDDVDVTLEQFAMKKSKASVTWYFDGNFMYYSYDAASKFVENLLMVSTVINLLVDDFLEGRLSEEEFITEFSEDPDIEKHRKEARETLGVDENCLDWDLIAKQYKTLAKKYHPDMEGGDSKKFKAINRAHKLLKRELC